MAGTGRRKLFLQVLVTAGLLLLRSPLAKCQNAPAASSPGAPSSAAALGAPSADGLPAA